MYDQTSHTQTWQSGIRVPAIANFATFAYVGIHMCIYIILIIHLVTYKHQWEVYTEIDPFNRCHQSGDLFHQEQTKNMPKVTFLKHTEWSYFLNLDHQRVHSSVENYLVTSMFASYTNFGSHMTRSVALNKMSWTKKNYLDENRGNLVFHFHCSYV